MPNEQTKKQDLIDVIDFSEVDSLVHSDLSGNEHPLCYWRDILGRYEPYHTRHGISYSLIFVHLCKNFIKKPTDVLYFVTPFCRYGGPYNNRLENYLSYMTDDEKRIVFRSFNVGNLIDMMNIIDTNANVFNAVLENDSAANEFVDTFSAFSEHDLDLFLQETGAEKFVAHIKMLQVKEKEKLAARRAEELKQQEAAAKEQAELEKKQQMRNEKISKRLQKLAENMDKGIFKYTMKLPFDKDISRADIDALSHDDPGVRAMFDALVNAQNKITMPDQLKTFNDMLVYMSGHFKPMTCMHHASVEKMMAAAGVKDFKESDAKPKTDRDSIIRYRHILYVIDRYPVVFKDVFGLNKTFTRNPHDENFDIFKYDSASDLKQLQINRQKENAIDDIKNEYWTGGLGDLKQKRKRTSKSSVLKRAILSGRIRIKERKRDRAIQEALAAIDSQTK